MEPTPPLRADPEFRPASGVRSLPPVPDPVAYRRVLGNPFLGLIGIASWFAAARATVMAAVDRGPVFIPLLVAVLATTPFLPRLFQYHCLDCGRTGRLSRWKQHVCPAVARRILEGRPRRRRGPGPMAQMLLWFYVLAIALVFARSWSLTLR